MATLVLLILLSAVPVVSATDWDAVVVVTVALTASLLFFTLLGLLLVCCVCTNCCKACQCCRAVRSFDYRRVGDYETDYTPSEYTTRPKPRPCKRRVSSDRPVWEGRNNPYTHRPDYKPRGRYCSRQPEPCPEVYPVRPVIEAPAYVVSQPVPQPIVQQPGVIQIDSSQGLSGEQLQQQHWYPAVQQAILNHQ